MSLGFYNLASPGRYPARIDPNSRVTYFCLLQATVVVIMVPFLSVLFGICCVGIVIILRLLIVIRSGSRCKPGQKGPVCVLVVAGSGALPFYRSFCMSSTTSKLVS